MAVNGSFNTNSISSFYVTFNWWRTGYDIAGNFTDIAYEIVAHNTPRKL